MTIMMNTVEVRNACKHYGKGNDQKIILNHLNMTVSPGSIYGLMGASGCGKTTLLSSILGMLPLDEGEIAVLGYRTKSNEVQRAGSRIGYMPQETALIGELTIKETIYYFGKIFQMDIERVRERYDMLHKLLELPDSEKRVEECSGGQMRRVSFAAAMVHEPDLLILDEPTVGLDPILREKIWNFMLNITRTSKLAVIITTHYIEEARQADRVGLMRNGILLAEETPMLIINRLGVENLEEAFYQLCLKRGVSEEVSTDIQVNNNNSINEFELKENVRMVESNMVVKDEAETFFDKRKWRWFIVKALLIKNLLQLKRQPAAIVFLTFLPLVQLVLFSFTVGGNPIGLKLGIVDHEISSYEDCFNSSLINSFKHDATCEYHKISCRFLAEITEDIAIKVFYKSFEEALSDAKKGKLTGIIRFDENFSEAVNAVQVSPQDVDINTRRQSVIKIYLDQSDLQITTFLQKNLYGVYRNYSQTILGDCGYERKGGNIPMEFEKPIYGTNTTDFKRSMVMPFVMLMIFYIASGLSIASFIYERKEGFWNRTLLAGVTATEMTSAHFIIHIAILSVQLLEVMALIISTFSTNQHGSYFAVAILIAMNGCSGLFFGLCCSCIWSEYMQANLLMTGISQPMIVLAGMFWPVEGMPLPLRYFAYLTPATLPSESVRNLIFKGYSITHPSVLLGFAVLLCWMIVAIVLGVKTLEKHKYSRNT